MQNVEITMKDKKMIITVDLSVKGTPSASGKSLVIGSTKGNVEVGGSSGVKVGVNVYKPK